jgi:hypothetical protein
MTMISFKCYLNDGNSFSVALPVVPQTGNTFFKNNVRYKVVDVVFEHDDPEIQLYVELS